MKKFRSMFPKSVQQDELNLNLPQKEILNLLETMWYGSFLVAHMSGKDISSVQESNLKWLTYKIGRLKR